MARKMIIMKFLDVEALWLYLCPHQIRRQGNIVGLSAHTVQLNFLDSVISSKPLHSCNLSGVIATYILSSGIITN